MTVAAHDVLGAYHPEAVAYMCWRAAASTGLSSGAVLMHSVHFQLLAVSHMFL